MKLFELRACWEEHYDCPDNGDTKICDTYETIAFAIDDPTQLHEIAAELTLGYGEGCWNPKRCNELRALYPGYDDFRDTQYNVVDVSSLIVQG